MRGAVPVALALGLPAGLPAQSELVNIVFGIVLFSLLGQGLTMPVVIRRLGLDRKGTAQAEEQASIPVPARAGESLGESVE